MPIEVAQAIAGLAIVSIAAVVVGTLSARLFVAASRARPGHELHEPKL